MALVKGLRLALLASFSLVLMAPVGAHAATGVDAGIGPAGTHCVIRIERIAPDSPKTRVVSRTCGDTRQASIDEADTWTALVTFYQHADYGGDSTDIQVTTGTCDGSGYDIDNMDGVHDEVDGVSSYKLWGDCNRSEQFTGYNQSGTYSNTLYGNQPTITSTFNDRNMKSFSLWRG